MQHAMYGVNSARILSEGTPPQLPEKKLMLPSVLPTVVPCFILLSR